MALNKTNNWKICLLHSCLYSLSICVFLWKFSPLFFLLIVLTHFPIDFWSVGQKWLDIIHGRNFIEENRNNQAFKEIRISFAIIVYTVVDNTFHLTLMWLILENMNL